MSLFSHPAQYFPMSTVVRRHEWLQRQLWLSKLHHTLGLIWGLCLWARILFLCDFLLLLKQNVDLWHPAVKWFLSRPVHFHVQVCWHGPNEMPHHTRPSWPHQPRSWRRALSHDCSHWISPRVRQGVSQWQTIPYQSFTNADTRCSDIQRSLLPLPLPKDLVS